MLQRMLGNNLVPTNLRGFPGCQLLTPEFSHPPDGGFPPTSAVLSAALPHTHINEQGHTNGTFPHAMGFLP